MVTRRYSAYYFPCARSVPWLLAQFYEVFNTAWKCQSAVNSHVNQKLARAFSQPHCCENGCMLIDSHGRIQIWCASLAAGTCQVMQVSARPRTRRGRKQVELSAVTRETEENQLQPLISRGSLFFQAVSRNLYLDSLGRIPERVNVNWAGVALCRISAVGAQLKPRGRLLWVLSFTMWPHDHMQ